MTTDEDARKRAFDALDARVMAGRAYRFDCPEYAEVYRRRAVNFEAGVALPVLIETFAGVGAVELLWVRLDSPGALGALGEVGAIVMEGWQRRGRKP